MTSTWTVYENTDFNLYNYTSALLANDSDIDPNTTLTVTGFEIISGYGSISDAGVYNNVRYAVPTFFYPEYWFVNLDILTNKLIEYGIKIHNQRNINIFLHN